jgi:hypothetical protein
LPNANSVSSEGQVLHQGEHRIPDPLTDSESRDSETDTDWPDDESDSDCEIVKSLEQAIEQVFDSSTVRERSDEEIISPALTPLKQQLLKQQLVHRLMDEFWGVFSREWKANVKGHTMPSDESCPSLVSGSTSTENSSTAKRQKRPRDDRDQQSEDEYPERRKRQKLTASSNNGGHNQPKFACPYRKHNPTKYSVTNWRTCALTPQSTMARVK